MMALYLFLVYFIAKHYNLMFFTDKNRTKMTTLKKFDDEDRETEYGFVFAVSGPG